MTNKQRVLKVRPYAVSQLGWFTRQYHIYDGGEELGSGFTPQSAWANAAENLKRKKK